jgi:hypothetical protein
MEGTGALCFQSQVARSFEIAICDLKEGISQARRLTTDR